ncbi:hypothetical protein HN51_043171 [Arachis hypogaea]|uniref:Endoplasmic reticulum transmembrane protein n=1 Tax=Arachis hypogaea TaxID=3818 RepID=A0A444Y6Z7_ARAHY|nr:B-cell receptor-associated protein 31 [Arachis ipaensis]XP_025672692.1 B-cell receptor-associated protein 31 [Arachis hypogaea]QHN95308.1 B-cell receptor-associated protein [Arachis hypogaea]RYQ97708.1 hypothetical protein Ahy_B08g093789 [Arachis hypogaea]
MLHLLYGVILGEAIVILSFLFKSPLRKVVIVTLDRLKRGRGPVVVKTVAGTVAVVLASSLYSISEIRSRMFDLEAGVINPTDQVLLSKHILEASLMGFVLFLALMIDRLHHYIRELRVLRKAMEAAKKQNRSFEEGKTARAEEQKALMEEIATMRLEVKQLESECEAKRSRVKALEGEVVALKKQSEGLLLEYDRLLEDNQNIRSQLEGTSSHVDNKKSM